MSLNLYKVTGEYKDMEAHKSFEKRLREQTYFAEPLPPPKKFTYHAAVYQDLELKREVRV